MGLGRLGRDRAHRRDRAELLLLARAVRDAVARARLLPELQVRLLDPGAGADVELHEVRERDYFFIVSFSVWGLWAGIGIAALWQWLAASASGASLKAAPVLGARAAPARAQLDLGEPRAATTPRATGRYNLLMSVEPYGVLFTNGDNDTFPLWYLAGGGGRPPGRDRHRHVVPEHALVREAAARPDRAVRRRASPPTTIRRASSASGRTRSERRRRLHGQPAQADGRQQGRAPAATSRVRATRPSRSSTSTTRRSTRGAGATSRCDEARAFPSATSGRDDPARAPCSIPGTSSRSRSSTRRSARGPIYFASSGNAAYELGLQPYLVRHGLAFKLNNGAAARRRGARASSRCRRTRRSARSSGPYVDVPAHRDAARSRCSCTAAACPTGTAGPTTPPSASRTTTRGRTWALAQAAAQAGDEEMHREVPRSRATAGRFSGAS